MANDTHPELEALAGELAAIEKRISAATRDAEKKLLACQFGQRVEHLADRIKALGEPEPPAS